MKLNALMKYIKPYRKRAVLALILILAGAAIDLSIPRLIQNIIDDGINAGNSQAVLNISLIMLGITLLGGLVVVGNNYLSVWVGEGFARDLREDLFLKIQSFSYGNLDRLQTGQLIVRLSSDIAILQRVVRMFLRIGVRAPFLMIGSLVLIFITDVSLAWYILPLMLVTGLVAWVFVSNMGGVFLSVQQKLDKLNTVLQENIAGVRVVKAFVRGGFEENRFEEANEEYTAVSVKVVRFMSTMFPAMNVFVSVGIVIVLKAGGAKFVEGSLTMGQIVAFINYLMTLITPLMIMTNLSQVVAAGAASAKRVTKILEEEPEIQDIASPQGLDVEAKASVSFEDVSFYYNGHAQETVLEGINLTANPGETVAILGATGSGKTSLVNLIPRYYDVAEGSIKVDGKDVRSLKQVELQSLVGIVPQETILFSGTVTDNIRYGRPNASQEEVEEAAKAAQAHEFILNLPQGYDTQINQRGVNLSGGQKQRIAIARALLTDPKILILDDSTSSVDVETESLIQIALDRLMKGRTSFVVAQRISTVLNADKIVVLDKGKIEAIGTHQELMAYSPIYKEIYDTQLGDGFTYQEILSGQEAGND